MIGTIPTRPVLRYHGGKWKLASWILSFFPEHKVYTEVFGGAASILIRKPRSYAEVYNDLDSEIVNVFKVLREQGEELKRLLRLTPFARDEFLEAYQPTPDPVEAARRTIIKAFMGFGSNSIIAKSGFRANSNRSGTTPAHDWVNYADVLDGLIERLRGVIIENRPALEIIAAHDSLDTLHYIDPPYLHSTRTGSKGYRHEMTDEEHRELAEFLGNCQGKVIVSGYPSELYESLYANWYREEKAALADGARKRVEVLWLNFKPSNVLIN